MYVRLLLLVAFLMLIPASLRAAETTRVVLFAPFSPMGLRGNLKVTGTVHGSCWVESLASSRPDAWRCMVGNSIHDPCFSNEDRSRVACSEDPFSNNVLLIVLNKALPRRDDSPEPAPWALRLSNGARCVLATGATDVIAGMRLNYACSTGGWVLGDPHRSSQPWRVFYAPDIQKSDYVQTSVLQAIL